MKKIILLLFLFLLLSSAGCTSVIKHKQEKQELKGKGVKCVFTPSSFNSFASYVIPFILI